MMCSILEDQHSIEKQTSELSLKLESYEEQDNVNLRYRTNESLQQQEPFHLNS